jgi:hypothetical protein
LPPGVGEIPLIDLGETVEGTLSPDQPTAYYQYEAEAGELIVFQISALQTLPQIALDLSIGIENTQETFPTTPDIPVTRTLTRIITYTQTYTMSVSYNSPTGTAQAYTLRRISPEIPILNYGDVRAGELNETLPVAIYRFKGRTNDLINLTARAPYPMLLTLYYTNWMPYTTTELTNKGGDYASVGLVAIEPLKLPQDGVYMVVLRRLYILNQYSVRVDDDFGLSLSRIEGETITYDVPIEGELTTDAPVAYYRFTPKLGDVISARVETDGTLDTVLTLYASEWVEMYRDDDSGPGLDPEIYGYPITIIDTSALPQSATYVLRVSTATLNDLGRYRLILSRPATNVLGEIPTIWRSDNKGLVTTYFVEAEAGETLTLHARLLSGPSMPQIIVSQQGFALVTLTAATGTEASATFLVPARGQVQVRLDSNNFIIATELSITRGEAGESE